MRNLLSISLCFLFLFSFFSITAYATSTVLDSTYNLGDTWSWEYHPTYNQGAEAWLDVQTGNQSLSFYNARTFIMWDLSPIPENSTINSAILSLYLYSIGTSRYYNAFNTSASNTTGTANWNEGTLQRATCGTGEFCNLDHNLTWNNQPSLGTLQSNVSVSSAGHWYNFTVTDAAVTARKNGKPLSIAIKDDRENLSTSPLYYTGVFYSSSGAQPPKLYLSFDTPTNCTTSVLGSYCDSNDPDRRGILVTPDFSCVNDTYYQCPLGSICTQILPQVDITTPIVENFTDCSVCWFAKIWTVNGWKTLWTNCPNNPECDNCNGYYCQGNNFITNLTSTPSGATNYVAGCFNNNTQSVIDIIQPNGTHINVTALTQSIFTNTTYTYNGTCSNTSTTCFDSACNIVQCPALNITTPSSNFGSTAAWIGRLFGVNDTTTSLWIFSMMASLGAGLVVLFKVKQSAAGFIFTALCMLIMFTLVGWFPAWVMIILLVLSSAIVAMKLKVG